MSWLKTLGRQGTRNETEHYANGGQATWVDGYLIYIRYDDGCPDHVWLTFEDGEYKVLRVLTHDGFEFTGSGYGESSS